MSEAQIYGLCGAGLVGIGLYGALVGRSALRRLLAFNLLGGGVFLVFGAIARRGGLVAGVLSDPVPQALVITGLVVAFAATALAVALLIRIRDLAPGQDAERAVSSKPVEPPPELDGRPRDDQGGAGRS
jgi:multicomponent Na+:H+ antiporter subunit C